MHNETNKTPTKSIYFRKGFSLIELLVVVSLIAVLMGVTAFGVRGSREQSRDAQRKADLESIRLALEIYRADNGNYGLSEINCDSSLGPSLGECLTSGTSWGNSAGFDTLNSLLVPNYIQVLPVDPINNSTHKYNFGPVCNQVVNNFCNTTNLTKDCTASGCCAYELTATLETATGTYYVCSP